MELLTQGGSIEKVLTDQAVQGQQTMLRCSSITVLDYRFENTLEVAR